MKSDPRRNHKRYPWYVRLIVAPHCCHYGPELRLLNIGIAPALGVHLLAAVNRA